MGFLTFNGTYYRRKLETFENKRLTGADVYEIRQLLKVLDDLTDEGYTNLNDRMEADFSCLSRLRALLKKEGASPFTIEHEEKISADYTSEKLELSALLETLMNKAAETDQPPENPFLKDIRDYCRWIGYEKDTAYVFLLRDALLPYVYYKKRHGEHIYPWLVSRRFLEDITGIPYVDDDIRLPIYEALENGCMDFEDSCSFCRKEILDVLERHQELKRILLELLGSVKEEHVMVIESGYMGTIPMMLKALDDRVTFRLYTTAPFLYETYKDHIFCRRYEDIRKFETVYAQDLLTRYAAFSSGKFYVNVAGNENVRKRSIAEINDFI